MDKILKINHFKLYKNIWYKMILTCHKMMQKEF